MHALKEAIPHAVARLIRPAPFSQGKLDFAWGLSVGPTVQRNTSVRLEGTKLVVRASSPQWSDEVRRSARVILARLRAMLGDNVVEGLEINC